jgi:hypothetical protein
MGIGFVEEDRHRRVARALGVLEDLDRSVVGQRPRRLGGVGIEIGSRSTARTAVAPP